MVSRESDVVGMAISQATSQEATRKSEAAAPWPRNRPGRQDVWHEKLVI